MKKKDYPWNIGDEFVAPKWDGLTVYKVDKIGPDYIQASQPGSRMKLKFSKTTIIPVKNHEHTN